jgi:hypothetical protein
MIIGTPRPKCAEFVRPDGRPPATLALPSLTPPIIKVASLPINIYDAAPDYRC